jgi:hypothetical protein
MHKRQALAITNVADPTMCRLNEDKERTGADTHIDLINTGAADYAAAVQGEHGSPRSVVA